MSGNTGHRQPTNDICHSAVFRHWRAIVDFAIFREPYPCFGAFEQGMGRALFDFAAPSYSIASPAPIKTEVGIERPGNFAVRPLRINS